MFRKLISNLSFSPALIHEVGFYAHRLKKEEATRQLTVVFMIMALIVQSLALFSPPESANASSEQDLLLGGIKSKDELISRYKANEANFKDIFVAAGIQENEVTAVEPATVRSRDNTLVMSRVSHFNGNKDEAIFTYTKSDTGQRASTYISPLRLWDTSETARQFGTDYPAWVGQSNEAGWFAILKQSGNLVTKTLPTAAISPTSPIGQTITSVNLSQASKPAGQAVAEPGDRISYTIAARNDSSSQQLAALAIDLGDVLEYGSLIDNGTGSFDEKSRTLSWVPVSVDAGQTEQRTFVVQLLDPLPATPQGTSNNMSYDCVLSASYGESNQVRVHCPNEKQVEAAVGLLPGIGTTGNIIFATVIMAIVLFFYFRTRQLKEEIRLIRHNLNAGTL